MTRTTSTMIAIFMIVMGMTWTACSSTGHDGDKLSENPDSLIAKLSTFNDKLPITFVTGDELDSVYYDSGGNRAVFNLVIDDVVTNQETGLSGGPQSKQLLQGLIASSQEALDMYRELAQGGVDVRTVLMGMRGGKKCHVDLTDDEILAIKFTPGTAAVKASQPTTSRDSLDVLIDSINAMCPDSTGRNIEMTRVQVENNYLVYNYVVEESGKGTTVDRLKGELKGWEAAAESKLRKPSPEMLALMKLCINNSLGMKHRYVGKTTRQAIDYSFTAVDLSKMCDHPLPADYVEITERVKTPRPRPVAPADQPSSEAIY